MWIPKEVQDLENRICTPWSDTFRNDHCFRLRGHVDSEFFVWCSILYRAVMVQKDLSESRPLMKAGVGRL